MVQSKAKPEVRELIERLRAHGVSEGALATVVQEADVLEGGISINSAARELNVPQDFLWRWAQEDKIRIIRRGKGQGSPTIISLEDATWAADLYHKAKSMKRQPRKLLEETQN